MPDDLVPKPKSQKDLYEAWTRRIKQAQASLQTDRRQKTAVEYYKLIEYNQDDGDENFIAPFFQAAENDLSVDDAKVGVRLPSIYANQRDLLKQLAERDLEADDGEVEIERVRRDKAAWPVAWLKREWYSPARLAQDEKRTASMPRRSKRN